MRSLLGGFSFAGTYGWESGPEATVRSSVDSNLNGDNAGGRGTASTVTPLLKTCTAFNGAGTCAQSADFRTVGYLVNNLNAQYIQAGTGTIATGGRNTLPLPGINNLDFSIFKNFQLYEKRCRGCCPDQQSGNQSVRDWAKPLSLQPS